MPVTSLESLTRGLAHLGSTRTAASCHGRHRAVRLPNQAYQEARPPLREAARGTQLAVGRTLVIGRHAGRKEIYERRWCVRGPSRA